MRFSTIILTVIIVVVGIGAGTVMSNFAVEVPEVKPPATEINVAVLVADIKSHRPHATIIGSIEAKDIAILTSPLETDVLEVMAEEGDLVSQNASLVKLDTRETYFQLEGQLASIDDINAQLDALRRDLSTEQQRMREIRKLVNLAEEELERNETLLARGVVAQAAVDQAESMLSGRKLEILAQQQKIGTLLTTRRRLEASERGTNAQVGQLRLVLERAQILAPFDGVVRKVTPSAGSRVARGAQLLELYDPSTLRLRAAIPNEFSAAAFTGEIEAELTTAAGTETLQLDSVAPEAKPGRGSVDALFNLPDEKWLLGATVEFDLLLPAQDNTVAVPFDAVYSDSLVYVVNDESRAQAVDCVSAGQTVTAGRSLALLRCDGLKPEDQIVINRVPNLISGTKLKVAS